MQDGGVYQFVDAISCSGVKPMEGVGRFLSLHLKNPFLWPHGRKQVLPKLSLTAREMAGLCRRLESRNGGGIDVAAALRFFGYKATGSVPLSSPTNPDMAGAVDEQAHDADVAVEEEEDSATHVEVRDCSRLMSAR